MTDEPLLRIRGLKTHFFADEGDVRAVDGVDLDVQPGRTLCIVGESGCGKSVTARSILQLVDRPGRIVDGQMHFRRPPDFHGRPQQPVDLASLASDSDVMRTVRGGEISMIFQEPMTSLSPVYTIGNQITEMIQEQWPHYDDAQAREHAIDMLDRVALPQPQRNIDAYPFELSGGMRQRAMIAMALACDPAVLIADEPTTALDVTTQAQILGLLRQMQERMGMAIVLITHDFGVVAQMADDVAVMYLGWVVEHGEVSEIFHDPKHPYTESLLRSIPKLGLRARDRRLDSIRDMVPNPHQRPDGCPFHPRCDYAMGGYCDAVAPGPVQVPDTSDEREVRCLLHGEGTAGTTPEGAAHVANAPGRSLPVRSSGTLVESADRRAVTATAEGPGGPTGAEPPEAADPSGPAEPDDGGDREASPYMAPQWKLVWWRFRKHRLAKWSGVVLILIYMIALFGEFLAPFSLTHRSGDHLYAPPTLLRFAEQSEDGFRFHLHVQGYRMDQDPDTLEREYTPDPTETHPVRFFPRGEPYRLLGLIEMDRRLFGPVDPEAPMYLLGADRQGRDVLSRTILGTRVSMTIGLIGVIISLVLGILIGGLAGYLSGRTDTVVQRVIEFFISIPTLPLWLALAAALPPTWSPLQIYFAITVILSLVGWTGLAREVRGRFLSLREEEFVMAAQLDATPRLRTIRKHLLPSFMSHIIATMTLAVPTMILAETALSFLGLGLQPPVTSWGVLLQEAQSVRAIAQAPWLLWVPGMAVVVSVLALNFLGDGLRDSADPYG